MHYWPITFHCSIYCRFYARKILSQIRKVSKCKQLVATKGMRFYSTERNGSMEQIRKYSKKKRQQKRTSKIVRIDQELIFPFVLFITLLFASLWNSSVKWFGNCVLTSHSFHMYVYWMVFVLLLLFGYLCY